jgi:hypothetical protein
VTTRRVITVLAVALAALRPLPAAPSAQLWDDRPVNIVQTSPANFPPTLAAEGVSHGEVRAVLNVGADGRLADCLITAYTRRELADELISMLPQWTYEPARQRGEPVSVRTETVFTFEARGMVVSLTPQYTIAAATNRLIRPTLTILVCRPSELDEPVRALHVVEPHHPGNRVPSPPSGPTALIDFYIDAEGRTRMPVTLRAAHELYAAAAIEALLQWRFTPPTRHGRPMIARATQLFSFAERRP